MKTFELDHLIVWLSSSAANAAYDAHYGETDGLQKRREDAAYFRAVRENLAGLEYVGLLQHFRAWYRETNPHKPEIRYDFSTI